MACVKAVGQPPHLLIESRIERVAEVVLHSADDFDSATTQEIQRAPSMIWIGIQAANDDAADSPAVDDTLAA